MPGPYTIHPKAAALSPVPPVYTHRECRRSVCIPTGRSHKCPQHCDLGRPHARSFTCTASAHPDLSVSCLLHQHCFTWQHPSPCPSLSYTSQGSCQCQATFFVPRHLLLLQCLVADTLPGREKARGIKATLRDAPQCPPRHPFPSDYFSRVE